MALRWTATVTLEAKPQFRRIGYPQPAAGIERELAVAVMTEEMAALGRV